MVFAVLTLARRLLVAGLEPSTAGLALAVFLVALGLVTTRLAELPSQLLDGSDEESEPDGSMEERARVYRSALEGALGADGRVKPQSEPVLENLRGELGLTERDHALLRASLVDPDRGDGIGNAVLGRYVLEERLGEGSQATVYRAKDSVIGRNVVVKKVRPADEARTQLTEEMQALGRLNHPNVVTLYSADAVAEDVFLVLEYCPGGSLADRIAEGPIPPDDLAFLVLDLADGLAAVHEAGLVHGDVKPSNVLFDGESRAKLGDFGSARAIASDPALRGSVPVLVGSPCTMAPEQFLDRSRTAATDVYALSAVTYRALTGEHYLPLEDQDPQAIQRAVVDEPPRLPHPRVPVEIEPTLGRALAKDPSDRFQSMETFREELLEAWPGLGPSPKDPRPPTTSDNLEDHS